VVNFKKSVMLVAGDPSGDGHASRVVEALLRLAPGTKVFGMGGPLLAAAGMDVREDLTREALVGFWEVIKHLPSVMRRLRQCEEWLDCERPDLLVLVDYPGFNLRMAEKAAKRGIPVCYFIAPQVWAWHRERVKAMRRDIQKLLVIIPFEENFFREEGMDATYVGNPLMDVVPRKGAPRPATLRMMAMSPDAYPVIGILPGSRKSELTRIWPILLDAARALRQRYPKAAFFVPRPQNLRARNYPGLREDDGITFVDAPGWDSRLACDLAWVKSGTSTVETALLGTPMVVVYKVAPLSAFMARRLLKVTQVGMVNILAKKPCVPELLQEDLTAGKLVEVTQTLLESPKALKAQAAQFAQVRRDLSHPAHPAEVAAKEILKLLVGR
jgi:lipid-A-disaccharide synthase